MPLPRMTENPVVAAPSSGAERAEVDKWIQERKASYPSASNVSAKEADAVRCVRRSLCSICCGPHPCAVLVSPHDANACLENHAV